MKYLIILILFIFLSSCNNDDIKVEHPETVTTLEIRKLAEADTTLHRIVYLDDKLYLYLHLYSFVMH